MVVTGKPGSGRPNASSTMSWPSFVVPPVTSEKLPAPTAGRPAASRPSAPANCTASTLPR
ncbi:MAG: hypothetical protein DYG90_15440 [Chloroflexi bacterium CFX6]|nr:hypothetical protein [Chloroflexi bacterium CFX6]